MPTSKMVLQQDRTSAARRGKSRPIPRNSLSMFLALGDMGGRKGLGIHLGERPGLLVLVRVAPALWSVTHTRVALFQAFSWNLVL